MYTNQKIRNYFKPKFEKQCKENIWNVETDKFERCNYLGLENLCNAALYQSNRKTSLWRNDAN